jgi:hypothetical protein
VSVLRYPPPLIDVEIHVPTNERPPFLAGQERSPPGEAPRLSPTLRLASQAHERSTGAVQIEIPAVYPHMLRHACGYALGNTGHDTRSLQDPSQAQEYPAYGPLHRTRARSVQEFLAVISPQDRRLSNSLRPLIKSRRQLYPNSEKYPSRRFFRSNMPCMRWAIGAQARTSGRAEARGGMHEDSTVTTWQWPCRWLPNGSCRCLWIWPPAHRECVGFKVVGPSRDLEQEDAWAGSASNPGSENFSRHESVQGPNAANRDVRLAAALRG